MYKRTDFEISGYIPQALALIIALFGVLLMGRFYEGMLGVWNFGSEFIGPSYLWASLVRDFQFSVFLLPFLLLFSLGLKKVIAFDSTKQITAHLISLTGVVNLLLISYFGATQIPLGPEFWAYSLTEMTNTVIAAEQITALRIGFAIIMYLLMYLLVRKVQALLFSIKGQPKIVYGGLAGVVAFFLISFFATSVDATQIQKEKYANKFSYFISQSIESVAWIGEDTLSYDPEKYPLLQVPQYSNDVLGPFFESFDRPPNIVFLLVESLGGEFIGPSEQWTGFAPYLDSLSRKGLYWENGLSLSGRTFGMVPSLLGSLPFGRNGFMGLGPNYPRHQSLISILEDRGYYTAFYSGYDTYFDGLDFFLNYQGTDFVLNKQKLERLLPEAKQGANYWGIDDKTMLQFASGIRDTAQTFPRLEIYHTLQSHSPFTVPNTKKYEQDFIDRLNKLDVSVDKKQAYRQYSDELTTLLFADQAVRNFMQSYQKKSQFENTIFVITGDHWLIPVPQTSAISRYHVPIIIYSPKLKNPVHFKSVNTHAEVMPSLMAMLDQRTELNMPEQVHWIGGLMDTTKAFRSVQSVPFMRNKNSISDYLDGENYLFGDELYTLSEDLGLTRSNNSKVKKELQKKLDRFKALNAFVVENNRLFPTENTKPPERYAFITEYDTLFARLDSLSLTIDEQFDRARKRAFNGDYEVARAIAKRILLQVPEYHDVRNLIGRTNAWEGSYEKAESYFKEVLEMDPTYLDTYYAYSDNESWQGDYNTALQIINDGLNYHPRNKLLLERKIKILSQLDRQSQAQKIYQQLQNLDPDYEKLPEIKKYVGE